ncbi:MaoC/PaaZ C-terminal domain-containing protein [Sulfobacillus sp. hq2]|uniref:MaoC/PaaZ C-terminal domain-containing protein n=1 Tax=Sulfobacillus TaxID=28033 RepID=UPI001304D6A2|nr:MaoC/PaaZ C-terminal domain-containing protein [Sulfobacillus sp. hq2]
MFDRPFDRIAVGDEYISPARTVTAEDLTVFANWSGDHYPLHTDEAFAAQTRYGQRILHGLGVLSLTFGLIPLKAPEILALYGLNRVRFIRPVTIGTCLHARVQCTALKTVPQGGLVTVSVRAEDRENEGYMVAEMVVLMRRGT